MWVFHSVEREKEAVLTLFSVCEQILDVEELALFDDGKHALMSVGSGDAGKLLAGLERNTNARGATELNEPLEAIVASITRDAYMVKPARAGANGLLDWMKTVKNFHLSSLPPGAASFSGCAAKTRFGSRDLYLNLSLAGQDVFREGDVILLNLAE
jgi:hypothetical protein